MEVDVAASGSSKHDLEEGSLDEHASKKARTGYFKTQWGGVYEALEQEIGTEAAMTEMVAQYGTEWRDGLEQLEACQTLRQLRLVLASLPGVLNLAPVDVWTYRQGSDLLNTLVDAYAMSTSQSYNRGECMPSMPYLAGYPTLAEPVKDLLFGYCVLNAGRVDAYQFIVARGFDLSHDGRTDFLRAILSSHRNSGELYTHTVHHRYMTSRGLLSCVEQIVCPAILEAVLDHLKTTNRENEARDVARTVAYGTAWRSKHQVAMAKLLLAHGVQFDTHLWSYNVPSKADLLIRLATEEKVDIRPHASGTMKELVNVLTGTTTVETNPECGTILFKTIPCPGQKPSKTTFPLKEILALQKAGVPVPTWQEMRGKISHRPIYRMIRAHHGKPPADDVLLASRIIAADDPAWLREAIKDGVWVSGSHILQVLVKRKTTDPGYRSAEQKVKLIKVLLTGVKKLSRLTNYRIEKRRKQGPVGAFALLKELLDRPCVESADTPSLSVSTSS